MMDIYRFHGLHNIRYTTKNYGYLHPSQFAQHKVYNATEEFTFSQGSHKEFLNIFKQQFKTTGPTVLDMVKCS